MQKILNYSALVGINRVTFVQSKEVKLEQDLFFKPVEVSFQMKNAGVSEIVALVKDKRGLERDMIVCPAPQLLLFYGQKGMALDGIPVRYLYSAEMYWISRIDPVAFFKVMERYSISEQRNGR
jgi:hypothetical protein